VDSDKQVQIDAKKMMKARASLFFLFGIVLLFMFIFTWSEMDIVRLILFGFMVVLLFFGAILMFIMSLKADDQTKKLDINKPIFQCKYCGEEFNSQKLKDRHERSCVKMKI
jgi:hypothetical protein